MRAGLVIETVTHLTLATTTSPLLAMPVLFLFGVHEAAWGTTAVSIRQRAVPDELQGRVASAYLLGVFGGLVVGAALGGVLAGAGCDRAVLVRVRRVGTHPGAHLAHARRDLARRRGVLTRGRGALSRRALPSTSWPASCPTSTSPTPRRSSG
ncbi:MAG: hypothetical protein R2713_02105 [Ilumatobacteraceae bacterium]